MQSVLVKWAFALYKGLLSPLIHLLFGPAYGCRFQPTCSVYAREAFHKHGWAKGLALSAGRLCRCHPFSTGGFDPVPQYDIASSRKVRANGS